MRPHNLAAVIVSLSCAILIASCVQGSEAEGAGSETDATAEAQSDLTDPECAAACDREYEARNARCRRINGSALRQTCWIASNAAYAICLKLCPDLTPCPPD
jgi:hypothetical protein